MKHFGSNLKDEDIDLSFKDHFVRSSSSTKSKLTGFNLEEIIKRRLDFLLTDNINFEYVELLLKTIQRKFYF